MLGVRDLGMELHARRCRGRDPRAPATGTASVRAVTANPGGAAVIESPWLIHTICRPAGRANSSDEPSTCSSVRPYSPLPGLARPRRRDRARRAARRNRCRAAGRPRRRSRDRSTGAPSTCTDAGPPERMIAFGLAREHLRDRHRARHDLAVDVRLAHAPRDQLRVLRPEVDDEDEVGLSRSRVAIGSGRHVSAHADALRALERLALGLQRRARPSLRPSGIPSPSRSRSWPSTCAARRRG